MFDTGGLAFKPKPKLQQGQRRRGRIQSNDIPYRIIDLSITGMDVSLKSLEPPI